LKKFWEKRVNWNGGKGKLKVKVVFGEEDAMIGKKERMYFEDCWTQEKCGRGVEIQDVEVEGIDHDSVVEPSKGAVEELFSVAKRGVT
jgi:hypothetical protein